MSTTAERTLTEKHRRELCEGSGLTEATIEAAGVYSEHDRTKLAAMLNWKSCRRATAPALVFPYYDLHGATVLYRIKPNNPPKDAKTGKHRKYLQPSGVPVRAYIPPQVRDKLSDATCRLVITEGEKKALAAVQAGFACVGLSGVDCWHTKGTAKLLPDLDRIAWQGRQVFVAFDSDAATNDNVTRNECELAAVLADRGAVVKIVRIPPADNGDKQGVDDFLVARGPGEFQKLLERADDPEPPDGGTLKAPAKSADPADEAKRIVDGCTMGELPRLRFYRGGWWWWSAGCYREKPPEEVRGEVVNRMNDVYFDVRRSYVADVFEQLKAKTMLATSVEAPAWLGKPPHGWSADECLATKTSVVHLPSLVDRRQPCEAPASPAFFTTNATDFALDLKAKKPKHWLRFLKSLWGDDTDSIESLREWFGYLLTADTRQQKMLLLVGPKRSGKGTIARILTALVGRGNVAAPTLGGLATNFGLWPLIARTVAIISDARLSGRADQVAVVERLLTITGEDSITVDRKNMQPLTLRLPTRFVILTNELPKFSDASGAIVSRVVLLRTTKSFYGAEDHDLEAKLLTELPGILLWAIGGWVRLRQRGRFTQPDAGLEALGEMNDLASPIAAFVRDCCIVGAGEAVPVADLFAAWKRWCESQGREKYAGTVQTFGRDLLAAEPGVAQRRPRVDGERLRVYEGIRLCESL